MVTGCARLSGIGRAVAHALAADGAAVVVTDVVEGGTLNAHEEAEAERSVGWLGLPSLVDELRADGIEAVGLLGDVSVWEDARRLVEEATHAFGHIDILVNNAAAPHGADRGYLWDVPADAFTHVLAVNTAGTFFMSAEVARRLVARGSGGRIVNISSAAGRRGYPQRAAYSASKFAVIGLTQAMALELADRGVTVNAVCPGVVDTSRQQRTVAVAGPPVVTSSPVGRMGTPQDVARTVQFLASPAADFITGESIMVTGGGALF
jgi:NAD(P)-dependent dehydrogenase (short-subunit alcohol dehydrogenase family)